MPVNLEQTGGGGGTTLTGTGIARNTGACTELSGDVSTSGSNAVTIKTSVTLAGSPVTTTQSANDNSTKIATTAYVDAPLTSTGQTGFFGGQSHFGMCGDATNHGTGFSATSGYFCLFYLPRATTITKAVVNVSAVSASANKQLTVAIYPGTAGSALAVSGVFNVSTGQATGIRSATIAQSTVTLAAGWYYYAVTMNATDADIAFWNPMPGTILGNMYNKNGTRTGTYTPATPGTADANLPTLTANTSAASSLVIAFFEP